MFSNRANLRKAYIKGSGKYYTATRTFIIYRMQLCTQFCFCGYSFIWTHRNARLFECSFIWILAFVKTRFCENRLWEYSFILWKVGYVNIRFGKNPFFLKYSLMWMFAYMNFTAYVNKRQHWPKRWLHFDFTNYGNYIWLFFHNNGIEWRRFLLTLWF